MDTPTTFSNKALMMGLQTRSDEARNLGSWERRGEELKTLGTTQEHEDRDKDHLGVSLGL